MRNGSYIRALGRQSFEPSQGPSAQDSESPDHGSSISEQSQEMQRRLIKAQNDVLATVGVCLRDTKEEASEAIMQENEVGLLVGAVDMTVTYLAGWPLIGIRNRLQTYKNYDGLRYRDVLIMSWQKNNIFQTLSGMPAHLCYQLANVGRDYLQARFLRWLSRKPLFINKKTGKPRRFVLNALDRMYIYFNYTFPKIGILLTHARFSVCSWILVYPLYQHSALQSLHLIPPTPLLPHISSFLPFSTHSPLVLPELTTPFFSLATASALTTQALRSYFLFSFLQQSIWGMLQYYLFHRIRRILPRPDNPDNASILGALDEDDIDNYSRWDSGVRGQSQSQSRRMAIEETGMAAIMIEETRNPAEPAGTRSFSATVQIDSLPRAGGATQIENGLLDIETSAMDTAAQTNGALPPYPNHHMPADPAAVTARMRSARPQHHVTRLSQHPVDAVTSHATDGIATALSSGLESAVMRTVARSFMIRQAGVDMHIVEKTVYRPSDIGNLKLVTKALAAEWALMFMLFEGSYYASTFIGLRWFGYPRNV